MSTPEGLVEKLDRIVAERQADRLPSVVASVVRKGEQVWAGSAGTADFSQERAATPDTQYRIGSITKTFTATAIMQLCERGAVDLDDRLEQHIPGVANGSPTLRRLLCHLTGLQREAGDMFVTGESPTEQELVEALHEFVLEPGQAHHYSNLAFALLGQVVAAVSGTPYTHYVDAHIIGPLGLGRTTWYAQAPFAQGYLVDEYARTVWLEPVTDMKGAAAAAQLWSTVGDLGRWASFLASGHDGVLTAETVESMWFPQVMWDPADWALAWGLGLMLYNHEGRVFAGHGGAMAGHLAAVYVDRKTQIGAAALTNAGTRGDMDRTAIKLAATTIEAWPEPVEPWRPESAPPDDVRALLGPWWSEGNEFVFWWEGGSLRSRLAAAPTGRAPTIFERDGDGWLAVSGRERGERLRIDGDRLIWAGYPFTRAQEPFKA